MKKYNTKKVTLIFTALLMIAVIIITNYSNKTLEQGKVLNQDQNTIAMYIEDENGEYKLSSDKKFPKEGYVLDTEKTTCKNGGTITQDAETKSINGSFQSHDVCSLYFKREVSNIETTLAKLNITPKTGNPTFANAATTDEGVYAMEDDYGTSYYYRGAVTNNYVKFAGFWWRIIRVNGDGSLRIIYDGDQAYTNGTKQDKRVALLDIAWNTTNNDDAKYVGYMYGGSNGTASTKRIDLGQTGYEDSENAIYNQTETNIKTQLEAWYKTNIVDRGYDSYVSDEIFCNDRSFSSNNAGTGIGTSSTHYGAHERIKKTIPTPQFTCPNKNDAFTKNDTEKGNGKLNQKVGMITADEVMAAGSGMKGTTNKNYYLYKGSWYWASSPYYYITHAYIFGVTNIGSLDSYYVIDTGGIAPVINLSAEYVTTLKGDGTIGNEYRAE